MLKTSNTPDSRHKRFYNKPLGRPLNLKQGQVIKTFLGSPSLRLLASGFVISPQKAKIMPFAIKRCLILWGKGAQSLESEKLCFSTKQIIQTETSLLLVYAIKWLYSPDQGEILISIFQKFLSGNSIRQKYFKQGFLSFQYIEMFSFNHIGSIGPYSQTKTLYFFNVLALERVSRLIIYTYNNPLITVLTSNQMENFIHVVVSNTRINGNYEAINFLFERLIYNFNQNQIEINKHPFILSDDSVNNKGFKSLKLTISHNSLLLNKEDIKPSFTQKKTWRKFFGYSILSISFGAIFFTNYLSGGSFRFNKIFSDTSPKMAIIYDNFLDRGCFAALSFLSKQNQCKAVVPHGTFGHSPTHQQATFVPVFHNTGVANRGRVKKSALAHFTAPIQYRNMPRVVNKYISASAHQSAVLSVWEEVKKVYDELQQKPVFDKEIQKATSRQRTNSSLVRMFYPSIDEESESNSKDPSSVEIISQIPVGITTFEMLFDDVENKYQPIPETFRMEDYQLSVIISKPKYDDKNQEPIVEFVYKNSQGVPLHKALYQSTSLGMPEPEDLAGWVSTGLEKQNDPIDPPQLTRNVDTAFITGTCKISTNGQFSFVGDPNMTCVYKENEFVQNVYDQVCGALASGGEVANNILESIIKQEKQGANVWYAICDNPSKLSSMTPTQFNEQVEVGKKDLASLKQTLTSPATRLKHQNTFVHDADKRGDRHTTNPMQQCHPFPALVYGKGHQNHGKASVIAGLSLFNVPFDQNDSANYSFSKANAQNGLGESFKENVQNGDTLSKKALFKRYVAYFDPLLSKVKNNGTIDKNSFTSSANASTCQPIMTDTYRFGRDFIVGHINSESTVDEQLYIQANNNPVLRYIWGMISPATNVFNMAQQSLSHNGQQLTQEVRALEDLVCVSTGHVDAKTLTVVVDFYEHSLKSWTEWDGKKGRYTKIDEVIDNADRLFIKAITTYRASQEVFFVQAHYCSILSGDDPSKLVACGLKTANSPNITELTPLGQQLVKKHWSEQEKHLRHIKDACENLDKIKSHFQRIIQFLDKKIAIQDPTDADPQLHKFKQYCQAKIGTLTNFQIQVGNELGLSHDGQLVGRVSEQQFNTLTKDYSDLFTAFNCLLEKGTSFMRLKSIENVVTPLDEASSSRTSLKSADSSEEAGQQLLPEELLCLKIVENHHQDLFKKMFGPMLSRLETLAPNGVNVRTALTHQYNAKLDAIAAYYKYPFASKNEKYQEDRLDTKNVKPQAYLLPPDNSTQNSSNQLCIEAPKK